MSFDIDGKCFNNIDMVLKDINLYINIPDWIEERNIYDVNTKERLSNTLKVRKYGGLTYAIYEIDNEYAKIKTVNFGECLVKITEATTISNVPFYESGCY